MRALVAYYSETGNTEKVAQALYDGLKASKKSLKVISEISSFEDVDVVFCGFPVIEYSVPVKMQNFLKTIPANMFVAFFSTHGSFSGGLKSTTAFENAMTRVSSPKILGTFGVRGKVKQSLLDVLERKPEHLPWVEEARSASSHPNASDLEDAVSFGNNILTKARAKSASKS